MRSALTGSRRAGWPRRRLTRPSVKQFGQHMVDEHTALESEGSALAEAKGMNPMQLMVKDRRHAEPASCSGISMPASNLRAKEGAGRGLCDLHSGLATICIDQAHK